ncbi:FKBP-type peptidyl-prolyl cis-trans isomerase [uncultured Draconibacterium sp.]|uniref:FKBP-type peptidyl-prolyl cis-trans isomerase n=1 Tax=uncultured Draconibacterium sp. TaxID=1573823 RepID=UPI003260E87D
MNLKLITRFFLASIIGLALWACVDESEDYVPPTKAEETALLSEYLDTLQNRGLDIDTTSMGVYYIIDSVGNGNYSYAGDTCVVKYTGFFLTGDVFDTSGSNTFQFVLEGDNLIEGWTDGMKVIDEGGKAYLIVPSEHAYGTNGVMDYYGNYSIPPNTSLVFYIEMVEIKPLD